jgi:hypothetical protein
MLLCGVAAVLLLLVVAGRLLFAEALQQGTMSGFFKLIEQYRCVGNSWVVENSWVVQRGCSRLLFVCVRV